MMRGVWPPDVIPPDLDELIDLYLLHERLGGLPDPGGLWDQDARTMAVFSELAVALHEIRESIMKDERWRAQR